MEIKLINTCKIKHTVTLSDNTKLTYILKAKPRENGKLMVELNIIETDNPELKKLKKSDQAIFFDFGTDGTNEFDSYQLKHGEDKLVMENISSFNI